MMRSVAEAHDLILSAIEPVDTETVALADAMGRVLREPVLADRPAPPFDRVMMDGYAVLRACWEGGQETFTVEGAARAGTAKRTLSSPKNAIEVSTGAVLPRGCDVVVPVESCERDGNRVTFNEPVSAYPAGRFIHRLGSDHTTGDVVLDSGLVLGPAELAVAATEGVTSLVVSRALSVGLISTGDEVVTPETLPMDHQIRASHPVALSSLVRAGRAVTWQHTHAGDTAEALRAAIGELLPAVDVLLLTGGVSMGRWDLVPDALAACGVEAVFHRVAQRPGKPLWFGRKGAQSVFALPGNPQSALCCARRYVCGALDAYAGSSSSGGYPVVLEDSVKPLSTFSRFVPVRLVSGKLRVVSSSNSGHVQGLAGSCGMIECPLGEEEIPPGTPLPFYPWS